jgi:hypothetical protein
MIKSLQAYTQTEKGLIYINVAAILGVITLLFLVPILASIAGIHFIMFFGTIALCVINVGFYCGPQKIKGLILGQRLLFVYIPCIAVIGISIWDSIEIGKIINLVYLFYTIVVIIHAVSFSMLVAKVSAAGGATTGGASLLH